MLLNKGTKETKSWLEPGMIRSKQNLRHHQLTSRWSKLEILVCPVGRSLFNRKEVSGDTVS